MGNREIKFRAWLESKANPAMASMVKQGEPDIETLYSFMFHYADEKNIMQFTGFKDKNGKEIYEGDIYEVAGNRKYEVVFLFEDENGERICAYGLKDLSGKFEPFAFDEFAIKHGAVIGNIYENPELIKV